MSKIPNINRIFKFKAKSFDYSVNYDHLWYLYNKKFFGSLIFRGRKLAAFKMMVQLKYSLKKKEESDPAFIFLVAMMRITPQVILSFVRMGGRKQGIPCPISLRKKVTFATKFVIKLLRDKDKSRHVTIKALVKLLCASLYNKGEAIKKKKELYKIASLNRHLIRRFLR